MRKFTKHLFLAFCAVLCTGSLLAQWTSRTLPNGGTINKVLPINSTTAFIVGSNNAIFRTTNGGAAWEAVTVNTPNVGDTYNIMDIAFLDSDRGFAVTAAGKAVDNSSINGIVLATTDKGLTWSPIGMQGFSDGTGSDATDPTLFSCTGRALHAISCAEGAIYVSLRWKGGTVNHCYVFKSTDEGAQWTKLGDDMAAVTVNSIETAKDTVYIGGSAGTFKVSRDGGASWTDYSDAAKYTSLNDIRLIDHKSLYLSTTRGVFLASNYGASVSQLSSEGSFDVLSVDGAGLLYTGGGVAKSMRSLDSGAKWKLAHVGLQGKALFDLTLFNDTIYGCSSAGLLFSVHKEQIKNPVAEFSAGVSGRNVTFTNSSQNSGTYSWDFGDENTASTLNPVHTYSSYSTFTVTLTATNAVDTVSTVSHEVVVGEPLADFTYTVEDGNRVSFTNGSQNCTAYSWSMGGIATLTGESPTFNFPKLGTFDVTLTANNGFEDKAVTKQVAIDSVGLGWSYTLCGDKTLQKLWAINNQNAVVVGNETRIYTTADGGSSWQPATIGGTVGAHIPTDLMFFDDSNGFATYSAAGAVNGFMLRTADGGATWSALELTLFSDGSGNEETDPAAGEKVSFYAMGKVSPTEGYVTVRWQKGAAVFHGYVYKTTDAGATWEKVGPNIFKDNGYKGVVNALVFTPGGQTGYMAGNKFLLKTTDGAQSWSSIAADAYGFINEVLAQDAGNVFLATGVGTFKTTDGFATPATRVAEGYSFDIIELAPKTYVTGRDAETLKITHDDGQTWESAGKGVAASSFELALFNGKIYGLGAGGAMHIIYPEFFSIPVAAFTTSVADKTVTFTNTSDKATEYVWDFGDSNTSAEASPVHTYSSYGTYTVKLAAKNICHVREASGDVAIVNTGVDDDTAIDALRVWPNPVASGYLNVALGSGEGPIRSISILDAQGRAVYSKKGGSYIGIPVSLSPGLYMVRVEATGGKLMLHKIIVQ